MSNTELPPKAIDLITATDWIERWRDPENNHKLVNSSGELIKGFLIPGQDLTEVMAETGAVDARSYIGLDPEGQFHLLIVGVDVDGDDMVNEDEGQYVYDFTKPCPPMCSKTGPLK